MQFDSSPRSVSPGDGKISTGTWLKQRVLSEKGNRRRETHILKHRDGLHVADPRVREAEYPIDVDIVEGSLHARHPAEVLALHHRPRDADVGGEDRPGDPGPVGVLDAEEVVGVPRAGRVRGGVVPVLGPAGGAVAVDGRHPEILKGGDQRSPAHKGNIARHRARSLTADPVSKSILNC